MPRFLFHVIDDIMSLDEEGRELPSIDLARQEAIAGARELIAHKVMRTGRVALHHRIEIAGEDGTVLLALPYGEAVTIEH